MLRARSWCCSRRKGRSKRRLDGRLAFGPPAVFIRSVFNEDWPRNQRCMFIELARGSGSKRENSMFSVISYIHIKTSRIFHQETENEIEKNVAFHNFSMWSILKQNKNWKWNSSILGHFKILGKCYHMTKSSFTCFFGLLPNGESPLAACLME